ncbi:14755_t:CDS:1, partial [Racocetra fulgida]
MPKKRTTLKGYQKKELCLTKLSNPKLTNNELADQYHISKNSVRDILRESDYWINLDFNSHEAQSQRNR